VTFQSNALNYVTNDSNTGYDVFRRDIQTNTTTLISGTTDGATRSGNDALGAVMSSDGRYVAFIGFGSGFVSTADTNNGGDVFLCDVNEGTTTLLSLNRSGSATANVGGTYPVISLDGNFVYFESSSTDMVANPILGGNIFAVANQGRVKFDLAELTVDEAATTAMLAVTRSGNTSGTLIVHYATSNGNATPGSDYSASSGSLTFANGETTKTIVIPIIDDTTDEPDQTLLVTLSDFDSLALEPGSLSSSILTITDDDPPPSISIDDVTLTEGDGGLNQGAFTLTLSAVSEKPVTVTLSILSSTATLNTDYVFGTTTATVTPGATAQQVFFWARGDRVFEDDETFVVGLSNPINVTIAKAQGQATIQNDDPLPSMTINDVSTQEGKSGLKDLTFFVRLSNPSSKPITVEYATANGSAQGGSDYIPISGVISFPLGITTRFVTVQVIGDPIVEPDEPFLVNLSGQTNAQLNDGQAIGTILNDDSPPILLTEENTQSAGALDAVLWVRDPFPLIRPFNFSSDLHTRVSLFALNLDLVSGEDSSAVTAIADNELGGTYSLPVEFVGPVTADNAVSQVIVKLPDSVGAAHELRIRISLRGQVSNTATIRIAAQ
jgi:hypothetical protein